MKSVYKKLVTFADAVRLANETLKPLDGTERIPITGGTGRILACNVYATRNNPPFNRATMDGFAVRASELESATQTSPATLIISGESYIGQPKKSLKGKGNCFRISTGAIIPDGADSVVKVEDTEPSPDGGVRIFEPVTSGTNIAEAGSDISVGELLIMSGKLVDTNDIAVLASLGIAEIDVFRKLIVSVISTGNELISHAEPYREGAINDANGIALCNELNTFNFIEANYAGIVKDDQGQIKAVLEKSLAHSDIVILSGGSSAGESDLVYRVIDELEPGLVFHGILVKPGLPTVLGLSGEKAVIGLPGFPVSSMMIFRSIFLRAILSAGRFDMEPHPEKGVLAVDLKLEMGKQNLVPVTVSPGKPKRVYPVTGLSGSISRFISTDGFISLEGNTKYLDAGSGVSVAMWSHEFIENRPVLSGMILKLENEEKILANMPPMKYSRMSPRNSLRSLRNKDSAISAFYFTESFPIIDYINAEMGQEPYSLFVGKRLEVGFNCPKEMKTLEEAFIAIENGEVLSGPALRFLDNIVSNDPHLERLNHAIRSNISSYSATSLICTNSKMTGAGSGITFCSKTETPGGSGFWIRALNIVPAIVTQQEDFLEKNPVLKELLKSY